MLRTLFDYRDQHKYLLHEFVVMPDHFHVLITPADNVSLERAVQFIKGGFSFRLKSKTPVWQESFTNHHIHDENDYAGHREYIWMNPVRAGLARTRGGIPVFIRKREICARSNSTGAKARLNRCLTRP